MIIRYFLAASLSLFFSFCLDSLNNWFANLFGGAIFLLDFVGFVVFWWISLAWLINSCLPANLASQMAHNWVNFVLFSSYSGLKQEHLNIWTWNYCRRKGNFICSGGNFKNYFRICHKSISKLSDGWILIFSQFETKTLLWNE